MRLTRFFTEPCYLFRPSQIVRRLQRNTTGVVRLPWGPEIEVEPEEELGRSVITQGVYDLALTEAIFRLTDPGECAVDVGANIGYTSCVMAHAVGPAGRVYAFEPSSTIFARLIANQARFHAANLLAVEAAVSNVTGPACLSTPKTNYENNGLSSLEPLAETCRTETVLALTLDSQRAQMGAIGILKIDVEGHELAVLQGASNYLSDGVRDILFEEHTAYPAPTHKLLEQSGFTIYRLTRSITRPTLLPPDRLPRDQGQAPANYLATKRPARAEERFRKRGWRALLSGGRGFPLG